MPNDSTPTTDLTLNPNPSPNPSPAPSPQPQPQPSTESFSLRQFAQERGYNPEDFKDDRALAATLIQAAERYNEVEPLADLGRQVAPFADKLGEFQEFVKAQEAEAAQAKAKEAEPPSLNWKHVEYDPAWERYCEIDERTQRYKPLHPDFAQYARKLNDVVEARQANAQRLYNLPEVLDEYATPRLKTLEEKLLQKAEEIAVRKIQEWQQQTEATRYVEEKAKDFYQHDTTGQMVLGDDGYPLLTPKGEAMAHYCKQLQDGGMTDPATIRQWAETRLAADETAGKFGKPSNNDQLQTPSTLTPATIPAPIRKRKFVERAIRTPQRGGTLPDDSAPNAIQNPDATFEEIADRRMREAGITT